METDGGIPFLPTLRSSRPTLHPLYSSDDDSSDAEELRTHSFWTDESLPHALQDPRFRSRQQPWGRRGRGGQTQTPTCDRYDPVLTNSPDQTRESSPNHSQALPNTLSPAFSGSVGLSGRQRNVSGNTGSNILASPTRSRSRGMYSPNFRFRETERLQAINTAPRNPSAGALVSPSTSRFHIHPQGGSSEDTENNIPRRHSSGSRRGSLYFQSPSRAGSSGRDGARMNNYANVASGPLVLMTGPENSEFSYPTLSTSSSTENHQTTLFGPLDTSLDNPTSDTARDRAMDEYMAGLMELSESDDQLIVFSPRLRPWSLNLSSNEEATILSRLRAMKRPRERSEGNFTNEKVLARALDKKGAISVLLYHMENANPKANDVWPNIRDGSKLPARYYRVARDIRNADAEPDKAKSFSFRESLRPSKILKLRLKSPQLVQRNVIWPAQALPTELYEEIAKYLSRDDVKSMRLVCKEFDRHVSQVLFRTVVVPFNTEIYGMLGSEQKLDIKGEKKVKVENNKILPWKNANGDDVYNGHGLDVFRGFGPHIRRYGMSFDVNEDALAKPPWKDLTESHVSFWGSYEWPFEEYRRFEDVAGLELAADETPKMKTAFSMLEKVQELALSVNSGLGWLNGPDKSIRARILQRPPDIFGLSKEVLDRKTQAQKELWEYMNACHLAAESDIKVANLYRMDMNLSLHEVQESNMLLADQPHIPFMDSHLITEAIPHDFPDIQVPSFDDPELLERFIEMQTPSTTGMLYSSSSVPTDAAQLRNSLIPSQLTKAQREWLLETEWAQRAFLSSYMLAVIDNPRTFSNVHTLNISRLSSRYVPILCRNDFWDAMPTLRKVVIQVVPDWRTVIKDEAGFVETPRISPIYAINPFYRLLSEMISPRKNIKILIIGWAAGGEHAEGLHARNKHILPAPVSCSSDALSTRSSALSEQLLSLEHVEELTLKNCWITPPALLDFISKHDKLSLKKLVLSSVSLTAMPRTAPNQNQHHFGNNMLAAALAHLQQQNNGQGGGQQNPMNFIGHGQNHLQALQTQIQNLQAHNTAHAAAQAVQLQAQLQTLLQFQGLLQNNPNNAGGGLPMNQVGAIQPLTYQTSPQTAVRMEHRTGSWPFILDVISPGLNLKDFGSGHSNANETRETNLQTIELVSCGYVRLQHAPIDQLPLETVNAHVRDQYFTKRYAALSPAMLSCKDALLGEILQESDATEIAALNTAWSLTVGWSNAEEAKAVEFDGLLPGGTGRFSGVIRDTDRQTAVSPST